MAGIGFFAPLPLALMLPFMAGQSMLMGDAFGKSYQYGKRKISAMSNEEFNALTPADLAKDITADFTALIPELKIAMAQSTEFQKDIIAEMGEILKSLPESIREFIFGQIDSGIDTGGNGGTGTTGGSGGKTEGSIYDWIGKQWNNIFVGNLLSGIGINTAVSNYHQIKGHLENFLAGVNFLNKKIIDDATTNVKNFIDNLTPPDKEKEKIEDEQETVTSTPAQETNQIPLDFLASLTNSDFKTGGHRHRNYKGKLIHWNTPIQITESRSSHIIIGYQWKNQKWIEQYRWGMVTNAKVLDFVNKEKHSWNASFVLEFTVGGKNLYYLIKEHT